MNRLSNSTSYGRSPATEALKDVRELILMRERMLSFGLIPIGVTVYRKSPGVWKVLP